MINNLKDAYKIKNNNDWNILKENELLVDISNDAYFGYRAMEKKSQIIAYDPFLTKNLVRLAKDSKKFLKTSHMLILDINTIGYSHEITNEFFLKQTTRKIEEILNINNNLKLEFFIVPNKKIDNDFIYGVLEKIYNE